MSLINALSARLVATALVLTMLTLTACQTKPTRTAENVERKLELAKSAARPIQVTEATIIIDARPAFDYSMAHIPKSVPLSWSDFTEPEPAQRGILQNDTYGIARRLARAGIAPDSHVVVVGRGLTGEGEEGRIAWMLAYLGVTNVQFGSLESLKPRLTNVVESSFPKSVPIWKPEDQTSLNVTRDELLFAINQRGVTKPLSYKGAPARLFRILDVRSEKAYLGREGIGALRHVPNMDALNVPWQQFFAPGFRPNTDTAAKLRAVGITPDQRILVLDENGISSAAVTMSLRALGFENAGNVSGGLTDLLSGTLTR